MGVAEECMYICESWGDASRDESPVLMGSFGFGVVLFQGFFFSINIARVVEHSVKDGC